MITIQIYVCFIKHYFNFFLVQCHTQHILLLKDDQYPLQAAISVFGLEKLQALQRKYIKDGATEGGADIKAAAVFQ